MLVTNTDQGLTDGEGFQEYVRQEGKARNMLKLNIQGGYVENKHNRVGLWSEGWERSVRAIRNRVGFVSE